MTYATIQAAVDCAVTGDTLVIGAGTYYENVVVDKSLSIQGAGTTSTVVDGAGRGRVFTVMGDAAVTFANLTITGGSFETGGGIHTYAGSVIIASSIVTGNSAQVAGGGIYTHTGTLTIVDSTLSDNQVRAAGAAIGGGIYSNVAPVTISNSIITGNVATGATCTEVYGGGLYTQQGIVTITDSTLSGNHASAPDCTEINSAGGDGVYTAAGSVTISNSTLGDTVANDEDGSIAIRSSILEDTQSTTVQVLAATAVPSDVVGSRLTADYDADIAVRWMDTFIQAVKDEKLSPPAASRVYAYAGVALYEAVVPGMPMYQSLSEQLNAMPSMPQPDPALTYDWTLVANRALAVVAAGLFDGKTEMTLARFQSLREQIELASGETVSVNVFNRSNVQGEALGQAILDWAAGDNYAATRDMQYVLPVGDSSYWVPLDGQQPLEPYWGLLRPFTMALPTECDIQLDVPFSTDLTSAFYAQVKEVKQTVENLTPEEREIALYWADAPGETGTPPGHWVSIQNQIAEQQSMTLDKAAEMYALTNVAMADAFISTWGEKYNVQLVRPVTYITTYLDEGWTTVIPTPPFPEYPSGHSVASGAASTMLTHLLGDLSFEDTTHVERGFPARSYNSFAEAAQEAAMSRLYGGIHYRVSIENGLVQGHCVCESVLNRLQTQIAV